MNQFVSLDGGKTWQPVDKEVQVKYESVSSDDRKGMFSSGKQAVGNLTIYLPTNGCISSEWASDDDYIMVNQLIGETIQELIDC